jgi:glucokinase
VTIASAESRVLAVDVGGTSIKAEVVSADGTVLAAGRVATPHGPAALDAVAVLGRRLIDEAGGVAGTGGVAGAVGVAGAGVVLPGIVDAERRVGVYSANIGWSSLEFGEPLEQAWGVPVLVGHDVTCAGWAEWTTGAGYGCDDFLFVAVGTGISAAIVAGGRLLGNGAVPGAGERARQPGELGHTVVRPGGAQCECGARGCLEAVASAAAIARDYAAASGTPAAGALEVLAAAAHDDRARRIWDNAVGALADGLASATTLIAPERIAIGGGFSQAGAALLDPLRTLLADRVRVQPIPDVVLARHGERAGLAGAALLARDGEAVLASRGKLRVGLGNPA